MALFNSPLLETAIGVIFLYSFLAIICTSINEFVAQIFNLRGETLFAGIRSLLNDYEASGLALEVYNHPLVSSITFRKDAKPKLSSSSIFSAKKPSYISAHVFSTAILDIAFNKSSDRTIEALKTHAENAESAKNAALAAIEPILAASKNLEEARAGIESWFNEAMDRLGGYYKQQCRWIILFVASLVAFAMNADSFMILRELSKNPTLRQQIRREADLAVASPKEQPKTISDLSSESQRDLNALFGWEGPVNPGDDHYDPANPRSFPSGPFAWLSKILGIAISAFAASLGAPYWFSILNQLTNIRANGDNSDAKRKMADERDASAKVPADSNNRTEEQSH